jgi:hypothetical protein
MTVIQAETTVTTATAGAAVDVSAVSAPWSLTVRVDGLTAASGDVAAYIAIETSSDASSFFSVDDRFEHVFQIQGPIGIDNPWQKVLHDYDLPGLADRIGTSPMHIRAHVTVLSGSSPSLSYSARLLP